MSSLFTVLQCSDHIHNWPLQSFSQDCNLASHITHVVCVYFTFVFNDAKRQIFEKVFHGRFICQKSAERKPAKKYFFFFRSFDAWPGMWIRALSLWPHYLLGYGDFTFRSFILRIVLNILYSIDKTLSPLFVDFYSSCIFRCPRPIRFVRAPIM